MDPRQQNPLIARHARHAFLPVRAGARARPAEEERACVPRVVNDLPGPTVHHLAPHELARVRPSLHPPWEGEIVRAEFFDGREHRSRPPVGVEEEPNHVLDLRVRIENDGIIGSVHKPDRDRPAELATLRFAQDSATQTRAQHVELGFTHRPLQPQEQAVVKVGGVVHAIFIENERVGQCAELEESMPVG